MGSYQEMSCFSSLQTDPGPKSAVSACQLISIFEENCKHDSLNPRPQPLPQNPCMQGKSHCYSLLHRSPFLRLVWRLMVHTVQVMRDVNLSVRTPSPPPPPSPLFPTTVCLPQVHTVFCPTPQDGKSGIKCLLQKKQSAPLPLTSSLGKCRASNRGHLC